MKNKLTARAAMLMIISALSLCIPAGALLAGGPGAIEVHAEEGENPEDTKTMEDSESLDDTGKMEDLENPDEAERVKVTEISDDAGETEEESKEGEKDGTGETVSGNDVPEPECTCQERCSEEHADQSCAVCRADYRACAYVRPNVKITIHMPAGWHSDTTKVHISVEDVAGSDDFRVKSVQARVTQNGTWMDVTEDSCVEIAEDCSIYVLVTDQKNRTYEKSRYIKCFDYSAPTLNAAVSDGLLTIRAQDTGSGVKAVYVNGNEFTDIVNGMLNIRLQQFDAGYQYFTIQAMDHVGNMSEIYKTKNPYYSDPEVEKEEKENPAAQLPASAQATSPSTATAQVTEHTKTDGEGNTTSEVSFAEQKKEAMRKADASGKEQAQEMTVAEKEKGKEFYTIRTASEKVFYLIIDRDGDEEMVYFLTEISENDLLNVTSELSETLPKNSAVLESALPVSVGVLPAEDTDDTGSEEMEGAEEDAEAGADDREETEEPEGADEDTESPAAAYIILGIVAAVVIGGAYYFKILRKKEEDFLDEEDDEEEEDEEFEDEEEEFVDAEDEFFEDKEDADI